MRNVLFSRDPKDPRSWQSQSILLAKDCCSYSYYTVKLFSMTNDTETNNSVWQTVLGSFAKI